MNDPRRTLGLNDFELLRFAVLLWIQWQRSKNVSARAAIVFGWSEDDGYFVGDGTLSVILSKAFMLAEDGTILREIKG